MDYQLLAKTLMMTSQMAQQRYEEAASTLANLTADDESQHPLMVQVIAFSTSAFILSALSESFREASKPRIKI